MVSMVNHEISSILAIIDLEYNGKFNVSLVWDSKNDYNVYIVLSRLRFENE